MRIAVLGAGAWGTAMAISLAPRHAVTLFTRSRGHYTAMGSSRTNEKYLPGFAFPPPLELTDDRGTAVRSAELVLVAVPTSALRETLQSTRTNERAAVVLLCKGFEPGAAKLPQQV